MQDNMFFNLSIRENLELIAPEASGEEIIAALKAAALYDFVESLPDQMDTLIGERGIKLSGGQKQRLAIARLILQNPQIVILDEATSALDSIVESEIMDNLSEIFKGRTMIVISHKPLVNFRQDETYLVEDRGIKICCGKMAVCSIPAKPLPLGRCCSEDLGAGIGRRRQEVSPALRSW